MTSDRLELLAQVATWYYEENLGQGDIAERIGRSRSMVSRLLQEARERGLVEIRVHYPLKTDTELQQRLCEAFDLSEARVLAEPPNQYEELLRRLGELGARSLYQRLHDGIRIGVGWGTALHEIVRAIQESPLQEAVVVQLIGSLGYGDPLVDGPEQARWLAQKLDATHRILHAPLIVENEDIAQALRRERTVAETLALARQVEVALVGIGTVDPPLSSLQRAGYLSESDLMSLKKIGVVGDVVARQLDEQGQPAGDSFNERVIGIDLDHLCAIPTVIGVAGGVVKAPAILAALRGGYIDVLVTDAPTISKVFALHHDPSPEYNNAT